MLQRKPGFAPVFWDNRPESSFDLIIRSYLCITHVVFLSTEKGSQIFECRKIAILFLPNKYVTAPFNNTQTMGFRAHLHFIPFSDQSLMNITLPVYLFSFFLFFGSVRRIFSDASLYRLSILQLKRPSSKWLICTTVAVFYHKLSLRLGKECISSTNLCSAFFWIFAPLPSLSHKAQRAALVSMKL